MEMGDQEQAVVDLKVDRRRREQDSCHPCDAEVEHKGKKPQHRRGEVDTPSKFCKQPVKDFDTCWNRNQHRHDAEKGIDIGTCSHREEVVQPDDKGEKCDEDQRPDHGDIAE